MKFGPDFHAEHILADGTGIELRHIRPEDAHELRRGFEALSPESRFRRFLTPLQSLSDEMLHYLTEVDGYNHVAIIAVTGSDDLKTERGIGISRFVRLEQEPTVAEVAVTVLDGMQHRGLGRLLLETLAKAAKERGIEHFRAEVLTSNELVRHALQDAGAVVVADNGDCLTVDIPLNHTNSDDHIENEEQLHHKSALQRLLREAASSMVDLIRSHRLPML
ncbi:MAG: GNAT family N-acetyltransferase [Acidobacteria bacterium]|nr:GNAT family N-acetyltransferase [Acidobacteriota bacterium]